MEKVKIAFIGCGGMGGSHLSALKEMYDNGYEDFEIVAFCDIKKEHAQKFAQDYTEHTSKDVPVIEGVDELLSSGIDFDAAAIQVPHSEHHKEILKLIEAGKHVMTEKPLGITLRPAKMIMDAAQEQNVILQVAENYRLSPKERAIAWAIKEKMIGEPRIMYMFDIGERQWYWDWRDHLDISGGAWTVDGGVHFADLWINALGDIKTVRALSKTYSTKRYKKYQVDDETKAIMEKNMKNYRNTRSLLPANPDSYFEPVEADVEDTTSAILEFESGVLGTWLVSRAAPGKPSREITVHGTLGSITWEQGIMNYRGEVVMTQDELTDQYLESLSEDEKEHLFPKGITETVTIEWRYFIEALTKGRPLEVDGMVAYKAMAVPMAVYESAARDGEAIQMEDVLDLTVEDYQGPINKRIGL